MTDQERILVFVPTYRCAPQIVRVLQQFRDPAVRARFAEILVLDNRSPDDTVEAAIEKARALATGRMTIGVNRANYGLGGSHKCAFTYALKRGFSHVVTLHGDDQADIRDLLPVLERGDHRRLDCCLGARFHPDARVTGYSRTRIWGNRAFNLLFGMVAGQRLFDLGSGLNLYRTSALAALYWLRFPDDLRFNYAMILAHVERGDDFAFFPISWREEDQISNVKLASQAMRTLGILGRFAQNRSAFFAHEFRSNPPSEYGFDLRYGPA